MPKKLHSGLLVCLGLVGLSASSIFLVRDVTLNCWPPDLYCETPLSFLILSSFPGSSINQDTHLEIQEVPFHPLYLKVLFSSCSLYLNSGTKGTVGRVGLGQSAWSWTQDKELRCILVEK